MFKKLGFGLGAEEKYHRAYEKGVLLADFEKATSLFEEAAAEFEKRGDLEGRTRAQANASFYRYLSSRQPQLLDILIEALRPLTEIECIGSETEMMPVDKLILELEARKLAAQALAMNTGASSEAAVAAHERARDKFAALGTSTLVTYAHFGNDPFQASAERHQFLHAGRAFWHRSRLRMTADPAAAADEMSQAALCFRRAGDGQAENEAEQLLNNLRMQRTCWVCGREMQAQGLNFEYLPTTLLPYHTTVVEKSKQDVSTLRIGDSHVAVCVVCRGLIMNQAQLIAHDLVTRSMSQIVDRIDALTARVEQLSRFAHHH